MLCDNSSRVVKVPVPVKPADQVVDIQEAPVLGKTALSPAELRPSTSERNEPLGDNNLKGFPEFLWVIGILGLKDVERTIGDQATRRNQAVPLSQNWSISGRCRQFFICFGFTLPLRAGGNLSSASAKTFGWSSGSKTRNSFP